MRTVRQLVFDMDGTLLDSGVVVPAAHVTAVRRLRGPELTPTQVVASYSVGPPDALLAHLLGRQLAEAESETYYAELAGVAVRPYPGRGGRADRAARTRARIAVFTGATAS